MKKINNYCLHYFDEQIDLILPELKKAVSALVYQVFVTETLPLYRKEIKTEPLMDFYMVDKLLEEITAYYRLER